FRKVQAKKTALETELRRLEITRSGSETLAQALRRPEVSYKNLQNRNESLSEELIQQVEIVVKYAGYIARQENEIGRFKDLEHKQIPPAFDYLSVPSLRAEARQKLGKIRPATVGQAS